MSDSAERVLLIAHSDWREGRLAPLLQAKGYAVEWCCPMQGASLPADDASYAGAVVLGGVQSANDAESQPYLRQEIDWIGRRIAAGRTGATAGTAPAHPDTGARAGSIRHRDCKYLQ